MRVYFIVYLLTVLLCYVIPVHNEREYLRKLIVVFIPLFVFGALREQFSDQNTYEDIYNEIHTLSSFVFDESAHSEIGYQWLCYIMPSFRMLLIFTSAFMCMAYIVFFFKNVPHQSLVLAISLLFLSGNLSSIFILASMRNGIAISLFLLFFSFWQGRKIFPAAIVVLVAVSMHTSAIFSLPLAFLVGRKSSFTKKELIIWIVAIVFFASSSTLALVNMVAPYINQYFSRYDSVIELGRETGITSHLLGTTGSIILFFLLALFLFNGSNLSDGELSLLRVALLFPFALIMTSLNARMSQYYSLFIVVASSIINARFPKSGLKTAYLFVVTVYIGYFFYLWTQGTWFNYSVYHSILGSF